MINRLDTYFYEANKHIEHIIEAKDELILPITSYESLSKLEKFALNTLIFRFSKLQDLLGVKIFRAYLEFSGINVSEFGFFDILKLIEKEKICDIDTWNELRKLRNDIAHDYPHELDEMLEKINLFIKSSDKLVSIFDNIKRRYDAISK
jgi:GTP:adenosylcobinamide-phosphate guanylyltransferase